MPPRGHQFPVRHVVAGVATTGRVRRNDVVLKASAKPVPAGTPGWHRDSIRVHASRVSQHVQDVLRVAAVVLAAWAVMVSVAEAGDEQMYLRAGISVDGPVNIRFTDTDCASTTPAALYGCGKGKDDAPHQSSGRLGSVPGLDAGVGYAAASAVRLEVLLEYRPRFTFQGRTNFLEAARQQSVTAELSSLAGLVAAYLDLPQAGWFIPFIGAGAGASRNRIGETRMTFPRTTTMVPGAGHVAVAWMATAGVATELGARVTLDLAWRYTDLGAAHTGRGAGQVVWRDGSRPPLGLDLAPTRAAIASHGLRVSLRYAF